MSLPALIIASGLVSLYLYSKTTGGKDLAGKLWLDAGKPYRIRMRLAGSASAPLDSTLAQQFAIEMGGTDVQVAPLSDGSFSIAYRFVTPVAMELPTQPTSVFGATFTVLEVTPL